MMRRTEKLEKAVWCKSMCESIVCYGFKDGKSAKEYVEGNRYLSEYVEELGEDVVLSIMKDVIDNVDRIDADVITDSEGVSYNNIVFKSGYASARMLENTLYDVGDKTVGDKK